ncbi:MAG: prepilin peptidase [Gammaproteobacteria bacterium]|nr:prepilin peptidase [Gammaproteobacteria bacterium]
MLSNATIASSLITVFVIMLVSTCSLTDIISRRIPNPLLVAGLAVAMLCHGIGFGISGLGNSFLGLFLGGVLFLPLYVLGGTSAGDVKLMATVGALLGTTGVIVAGIATFICGGILGVLWILWRIVESHAESHVPASSSTRQLDTQSFGVPIVSLDLRTLSFPYAPAIAGGTFIAIWHLDLLGRATG